MMRRAVGHMAGRRASRRDGGVKPRPMVAVLASLLALAGCRDEGLTLPSGLEAELQGTVIEPQSASGETWLILLVLAPDLAAQQVSAEARAADTDALCAEWGVPAALEADPTPDQITVQIMSEPVERGQPAPGVTQVFAGYRFENGTCIWEDF